jgi:hypothetical protein
MPDYSNTTGRTYVNASGSVRFNNNILTVRKVKPSKTARDTQHAWAFGQKQPAVHVEGRETIEAHTVTVSLVEWKLFASAVPNWKQVLVQSVVSYTEATLGAASYNHKNCKIISETPSESDGASTGEALIDLELLPLAVDHFGKTGNG